MKNTLSGELLVVGWCIVCGCVSGIWYDFFRALRKEGFNANWMVVAEDIVFWIVETVIVYSMLFYANNGVLRWYEFAFTILSFVTYRWLFGDLIVEIFNKIFVVFKVIDILVKKFFGMIRMANKAKFLRKTKETEKKQR